MSDSYQAIYDAVRSRISGGNVGDAVAAAVRDMFDISMAVEAVKSEALYATAQAARPSVLYRPSLGADGTKWCALYGDDLATGIAGFGDTPEEAMADFDRAWLKEHTPTARRLARETAPA